MRKKYLILKLEGMRDLLNTTETARSGLRTELSKLKTENRQDVEAIIKVLGITGYENVIEEYEDYEIRYTQYSYRNEPVTRRRTNYGADRFLQDVKDSIKAVDGKAALKRIKAAQNG